MSKTKRFDYVKYDENTTRLSESFKRMYSELAEPVEGLEVDKTARREQALALTKLEESFMWVGKMLRNNQIAINGSSEHVPERG